MPAGSNQRPTKATKASKAAKAGRSGSSTRATKAAGTTRGTATKAPPPTGLVGRYRQRRREKRSLIWRFRRLFFLIGLLLFQ